MLSFVFVLGLSALALLWGAESEDAEMDAGALVHSPVCLQLSSVERLLADLIASLEGATVELVTELAAQVVLPAD